MTMVAGNKAAVAGRLDALAAELVALSRRIHAHPELGRQEHQAAAWIRETLVAHGFTLAELPPVLDTAIVATAGGGYGPTIGFLAEYDALPEVGHACGHNLLGIGAVGAAIVLKELAEATGGTVKLFGTPAEELGWGKPAMIEAGLFEGVDVVLGWHPSPGATRFGSCSNACMGVRGYQFTYRGRPAHSAVSPWEGVNALDAVIQVFNAVNAMRQQIRPEARIHGIITDGGQAFNIVPERAQARLAARSYDNAYVEELGRRIVACARGAAEQTGCQLEVEPIIKLDSVRFNAPLWERMGTHLTALGRRVDTPRLSPASTDFGNVSQLIPSVTCSVRTHPEGTVFHSRECGVGSGEPAALAGMLDAARAMALTGADCLLDPDLVVRARAAHAAG